MVRIVLALTMMMIPIVGFASNNSESTTLEMTCHLANEFEVSGEAGVEYLAAELTSHWPSESRERLASGIANELKSAKFDRANSYLIAKIGADVISYLIVLHGNEVSLVFVRLAFQNLDDGYKLMTLDIQGDYSELVPRAFEISPIEQECR